MARFFSVLFSICIAACAMAAPMHRRQIGNLDCNLARLKSVVDVADAQTLIGQINTTELSTATSVAVAQAALNSVNDATQTILNAVFANQTAPADSRDQFASGLDAALEALKMINDQSQNATVTAAQAKILSAGQDGNSVVADCK
ncbi:hypothetical protein B0H11DRAFT_1877630 [Mycena galericulata]|nr:hypothetical protein B0H11DRAFT_1877630 [Mycena galericulata]